MPTGVQLDELDSASALVLRQRANFVSFNTISADYTLTASDWGKWIRVNTSSDVDITVPPNSSVSLPVGAAIPVVRRGTGEVTFLPGSGVTINSDGEDNVIPSQFKTVLLVQDSADSWLLQGIGAVGSSSGGGGGDVTAPTVTSATATTANTIVVVFSEAVTGTTAGWSFNNGGALTVASRSGSGTNTWTFTITEDMTSGDTITRTYNSGTGDAVDGSSNALASFTGASVTNSIAAPSGALLTINVSDGDFDYAGGVASTDDATSGWNNHATSNEALDSAESGRVWLHANSAISGILGYSTNGSAVSTSYQIFRGFYLDPTANEIYAINTVNNIATGVTWVSGRYYGIHRDGSTGAFKIQESIDQVTWTDKYTISAAAYTAPVAFEMILLGAGDYAGCEIHQPKFTTL